MCYKAHSKTPLVLVAEDAPGPLLQFLTARDGPGHPVVVEMVEPCPTSLDQLKAKIHQAAGLIVRNRVPVDERLLQHAPHLKVIGRLGAGLDNIDLAAASRRGIEVVYSPWGNSVSVAEFTLALILALAKRIVPTSIDTRNGGWNRTINSWELRGRTLGILGFGAVGRLVATRAVALGMRVITYHPRLSPDHPNLTSIPVTWVNEDDLLKNSEILSVHLPDRPDTRNYLNEQRLSMLPPGSLLVNTGRGTVVDETALAKLLMTKRIGGAALDVRAQEPPPDPDPLATMENVILTPHVAGLSVTAQEEVCRQVAEDVRRVLAGLSPLRPAPSPPH